jgi:hypothetical protein
MDRNMQQGTSKVNASKILVTVSYEKGFHFNNSEGGYTGIIATSLSGFAVNIETIDENSILFHCPRVIFKSGYIYAWRRGIGEPFVLYSNRYFQ